MNLRFAVIITLLVLVQASAFAQSFTMLKDINPGVSGSNPTSVININGTVYFIADDGVNGAELWKTDGSSVGTVMVKDIFTGSNSSNPTWLTAMNGQLYFSADDGISGTELWKSDGTAAGTIMVKDILPGSTGSETSYIVAMNSQLYFSATDGVNGIELWKSDGTAVGTSMVKDINPFGNSSPKWLTNLNGLLIFSALDGFPIEGATGRHGTELWKSDGTAAGTELLKDINWINTPYFGSSSNPRQFFVFNNIVYFQAKSIYDLDFELYKSDGTTAGTDLVKDIYPGHIVLDFTPGYGRTSDPEYLTPLNGVLYFSANNCLNGRELWKTNGTEPGTTMVKDIFPGGTPNSIPVPEWSFEGFHSYPTFLRALGGKLYFSCVDPDGGRELWTSDGTDAGTVRVKDIVSGTGSSDPAYLEVINNKIYFSANDGINGNELWKSDGTEAGTALVQNFEPGINGSDPKVLLEANGKIFLTATTSAGGLELWVANSVADSPLPLTLLEFKGALVNNDGILQWKTDNELNTEGFTVERSTDGRHYNPVGTIPASNAGGIHFYNYTDVNIGSLGASIVYYRLRQTDVDNKFTYSRIVALSIEKNKNFAMLYPNPVKNDINLTITIARRDRISWQLTDNNGRLVKNGYYELSAGSTALSIDASGLSAGNYIIQLKGESLLESFKLIKQ